MNKNKKIIIIGTIASSLYTFRKDLILSLIDRGHTVHAFTSDSDKTGLAKIAQLGVIPTYYELSRGGLNPYKDLSNTISLYQKIKKFSPISFLIILLNLSSMAHSLSKWLKYQKKLL